MRVVLYIAVLAVVVVAIGIPVVGGEDAPAPTQSDAAATPTGDDVGNYARWTGSSKADLLAFWGQPHKVKRRGDGSVLVYELRVTCDGIITGKQYSQIGRGVVTGSQDPLDGIENNVPQGASRRAGMRVAARQTVRFFIDGSRTVSGHDASKPKTNWNRCKY